MTFEKAVGSVVEIIYLSGKGAFTKRRIRVLSVQGGYVRAYCLSSGAHRVFKLENILAARPVKLHAG